MGNMFTLVLLFLSFIIAPIFSSAQTTQAACVKDPTMVWVDGYCMSKAAVEASNANPVISNFNGKSVCPNPDANWDAASKTCNVNGFTCMVGGTTATIASFKSCINDNKWKKDACEMGEGAGVWNNTTRTCQQCSQYSKAAMHCPTGGTNCESTIKVVHCVCNNSQSATQSIFGEYVLATGSDTCPREAPKVAEKTESTMDDAVLKCIENVKEQVNACKSVATKTIEACDKNSAENAKIFNPVNGVINKATVALHTNAVNKGALEQCRNISLMSAAAGYGSGALQKSCSEEIGKCKQTCSDEVLAYSDENKIIEACKDNGGNITDHDLKAKLDTQAEELAKVASAAKAECGGSNTLADKMLDQAKAALTEMTRASQSAAQCENALTSNGAAPTVPLSENCALYPNSAGCPVNCAYDSGNVQCKCLNNPSDPSCKGSGGNLAAMAGAQYQAVGGATSNFKPGAGAGGGGLGDGLDLGDDSPKAAIEPLKENGDDGSMFKAAAAANAGGGGGGGGNGSGSGAGSGKGEEPPEKSFLGGTFAALKNAASNLFGGGTTAPKKPSASKDDPLAKNGFKPINPALRGLASNGKACYVDAKGAEYCFGRRNMDIFKMMNSQYSNQYNTLIIDK